MTETSIERNLRLYQLAEDYRLYTKTITEDLNRLIDHCRRAYNYKEPQCYEWKKSYLTEGGTDPLKYIYVFKNHGDETIARHWHYIGFGLSDIHGYKTFRELYSKLVEERVIELDIKYLPELYCPDPDANGFGFEITFRLKCNSDDDWLAGEPPSWPRKIMQDLARYVFQTRNKFNVGDHVAWHNPLDSNGQDGETSRIRHMLLTLDPQLMMARTSLGPLQFVQIVGVCEEELQAAREWNVRGILEILQEREDTGGQYLITDMRRGETIFDLNPDNYDRLEVAINQMGSDMALISSQHKYSYTKPTWFIEIENHECQNDEVPFEIDEDFLRNDDNDDNDDYPVRTPSRMSQGSESAMIEHVTDHKDIRYHQSIYILLSVETAKVLPIMLNGRLAHQRSFSFQRGTGDSTITFVPEGCPKPSIASPQHPFAKAANWLQIFVSNELREKMYNSIKSDFSRANFAKANNVGSRPKFSKNYSWPDERLFLTVIDKIRDD